MTTNVTQLKDNNLPVVLPKQSAPVHALEAFVLANFEQSNATECIDHFFSKGMYLRKMSLQAGELVVGATHNFDHFAIILKGEVAVQSRHGLVHYKAPYILNAIERDKRAIFAVTDMEWITIHATDETDITVLESTLVGD